MFGLDVNGNDNRPEWGYCRAEGCREEAEPVWYPPSDYPDDPDLLLCRKHIGERLKSAQQAIAELTGELRVWQQHYGKAGTVAYNRAAIIIRDAGGLGGLEWDETRCRVCGLPLAKSKDEGCMPDDCSMRPLPKMRADAWYR